MLEKSTYLTNCLTFCKKGYTIVDPACSVNETAGLILDAQGNQMAMYDHKVNAESTVYYLAERNIYGSSRLGTTRDTVNMYIPNQLPGYGVVGNRNYELNNHLGNVLAVISDIVYPLSEDSSTISSYEVGITQISDYSPFGVQLDGRTQEHGLHEAAAVDTSTVGTPTVVEIYKNEFDVPVATTSPYTGAPTTLDANLSNTHWTSSTGTFTNYSGVSSTKAIAISSASADTAYLTLSMNVASGYALDISSYSFYHRSSTTGYASYLLVVNGVEAGSGTIWVTSGSTFHSTGLVSVLNAITGQTGTVNVVLKLFGGTHGSSGTFRMDDFVLNGYTQQVPSNSGGNSNAYVVSNGYRYGFQGQEMDDEVKGRGNSVNFEFRMHDPRIGRFFAIDPLAYQFPHNSPYAFSENRVIDGIELEGAEYYYSASGTLLGKLGDSKEVRVINADRIAKYGGEENYKKVLGKIKPGSETHLKWINSDKVSTSAGMNNDELMTRAFLSTLKQSEAGTANPPLDYNSWSGTGVVFTEDSYEDNPEAYSKHPGATKSGRTAAGAYQFLERYYTGEDFSPMEQDLTAVETFEKIGALDEIQTGDAKTIKANTKLNSYWTSIREMSEKTLQNLLKENISNKLNNNSDIETPKGQLLH